MAGGGVEERGKKRSTIVEKLKAGLRRKRETQKQKEEEEGEVVVVDGSDITELVGNEEAFSDYVDHKFRDLDLDLDGKLSVQELQPAIADIGAGLGLPARGSSPDSDFIYSELLNEFTHGKQQEVSKTEFKEVLSDILLGMAAGLNRDPIVILIIDGEDLKEFVGSASFEPEAIAIYSQMEWVDISLRKCIIAALEQLTVDHGMPPSSDSWVMTNIVEPALNSIPSHLLEQSVSQETFLVEFEKVVESITQRLKEHPVIVAHTENAFDGSDTKRLLSNKFELDKLLEKAWKAVPKDHKYKASRDYLCVALDEIASSTGLPPYGAVDQIDAIIDEAFKLVNADHGKPVDEEVFKKTMREILGTIMLQLVGKPIFVSSNSVVHDPSASSSTLLMPSSILSTQPQSDQKAAE